MYDRVRCSLLGSRRKPKLKCNEGKLTRHGHEYWSEDNCGSATDQNGEVDIVSDSALPTSVTLPDKCGSGRLPRAVKVKAHAYPTLPHKGPGKSHTVRIRTYARGDARLGRKGEHHRCLMMPQKSDLGAESSVSERSIDGGIAHTNPRLPERNGGR